jgi:hypothetical protein
MILGRKTWKAGDTQLSWSLSWNQLAVAGSERQIQSQQSIFCQIMLEDHLQHFLLLGTKPKALRIRQAHDITRSYI